MEEKKEESLDVSSIKPVSSLRSRFENLAAERPLTPTVAVKRASILKEDSPLERPRSSIDVIRRPSAWVPTSDPSEGSRAKPALSNHPGKIQTADLDRGPLARPSEPLPLSGKPNLQSPVETPKKLHRPDLGPLTAFERASSVSLRSGSFQSEPSTPSQYAADAGLSPFSTSFPKPAKLPPPINRASKPQASKPSNLLEPARQSSLGPSPFTTPPSSDDESTKRRDRVTAQKGEKQRVSSTSSAPGTREADSSRRHDPRYAHTATQSYGGQSYASFAEQTERRPTLPTRQKDRVLSQDDSSAALNQQPAGKRLDERSISKSLRLADEKEKGYSSSERGPPPPPPRLEAATGKQADKSRLQASNAKTTNFTESSSADTSRKPLQREDIPEFPDFSLANRRPPRPKSGAQQLYFDHDSRTFDICNKYAASTGYATRVWDLLTSKLVFEIPAGERDIKSTAIAFKPGASAEKEGQVMWLGNNYGEICEVDIAGRNITDADSSAHNRREIIKLYRFQNMMWSVDSDGVFNVWMPTSRGLPSLRSSPHSFRVAKGHTFSIIVRRQLWYASGKSIRVYDPTASDGVHLLTIQPLGQSGVGEVTSGAVISNQLDRVYFGHSDGKVTIYHSESMSCIGVVSVSPYKISTLASAGRYLWAGYNTGWIQVYDVSSAPWKVKKSWQGHLEPVLRIITDHTSSWISGQMRVGSLGLDSTLRLWDGWLEDDLLEEEFHRRDVEFCRFEELSALLVSWNAGASTPGGLQYDNRDMDFFKKIVDPSNPPDLIAFGFQELVDLEDKKLTAKSIFKGAKKKEHADNEHMSRQYRAWRDFLMGLLEEIMPIRQSYSLLKATNMVGLFSCVFVKSSVRTRIQRVDVTEVKRGLGGLHGNKGAIILRFVLDDSSICWANCHLAAGQSQTSHRNSDITAILEATTLPKDTSYESRLNYFIGGGDGSMIMDHQLCILSGDMNYRIDTMGRGAVIKAVEADNLAKLLERDQLLLSQRRNPTFVLRAFREKPIGFAPTYKYDVGTDRYDTSDKLRSPAWCDRILFKGLGNIKQLNYQRHDLRASDHRPISARFALRIKKMDPKKRDAVRESCEKSVLKIKGEMARDARLDFLVSVLGLTLLEASRLVG